MPDLVSGEQLVIGIISGGMVNTAVLIWLARQVMQQTNQIVGIKKDIYYLRREVAYVNGRAEPEEDEEVASK